MKDLVFLKVIDTALGYRFKEEPCKRSLHKDKKIEEGDIYIAIELDEYFWVINEGFLTAVRVRKKDPYIEVIDYGN